MLTILIFLAAFPCVICDTILRLEYGIFNGTIENGLSVWRGVPFAKPPVGDLRFRAPQPPQQFTSVQKADTFGSSCIQFRTPRDKESAVTDVSEDCLYLNIWRPTNAQNLPILFWIYGGGFLMGSSSLPAFDGSHLVQRSNNSIIFVSANYRVGPLGFLSSEEVRRDGDLNAGLLDQKMALEWVRKYASAFGGDPTQITVMGESAGAISIGLHLISASTKRLFDKAILSSGSPAAETYCRPYKDFQSVYNRLLKKVGCYSAANTLECLRQCDIRLLLNAGYQLTQTSNPILAFSPVVDGRYIVEDCSERLKQQKFLHVPLIVGTNTNEGVSFVDRIPLKNTTLVLFAAIKRVFPSVSISTLLRIAQLYPIGAAYPKYESRLSLAVGEESIICPSLKLAKAFSPDVYKYRFNQAEGPNGAFHGADIPYMFHNTRGMMDSEVQLADLISDYYISFIQSGDPNTNSSHIKWPRYDAGKQIVFEAEKTGLEKDPSDNERCDFWNSFDYTSSIFG
ncbi:uncharacterized protein VTP21DRAFT_3348 [Calcarisporiella thermophila]|uniref:uncharacterized protein n=1 Tax=Calcarisporiella thermophila TaxID=911321 RepID=UPI003742DFD5